MAKLAYILGSEAVGTSGKGVERRHAKIDDSSGSAPRAGTRSQRENPNGTRLSFFARLKLSVPAIAAQPQSSRSYSLYSRRPRCRRYRYKDQRVREGRGFSGKAGGLRFLTAADSSSQTFERSISVPGHADWIRCLAFSEELHQESTDSRRDSRAGDILLASGSQDSYIRLWRFSTSSGSRQNGEASALDILDDLDEAADGEIAAKQYSLAIIDESGYKCVSADRILLSWLIRSTERISL